MNNAICGAACYDASSLNGICQRPKAEPHTCPFEETVKKDDRECECCAECEAACASSI